LQFTSIFFGLFAVISFIMAYNQLPWLEDMGVYYFNVVLMVLIPVALILGIVTAKIMIRKADRAPKSIGAWGGIAIFLGMFLASQTRNLQTDTRATVDFLMYSIGVFVFTWLTAFMLFKVYLVRKYAPYFNDMRLRRDK